MKGYTKKYCDFFGYGGDDIPPCEICDAPAVDLHHIYGRIGDLLTDISKIIALCRRHHIMAHSNEIGKDELMDIHIEKMKERELKIKK